ncbi:hypothetical protein KXD93_10110 [Mucilaginibacter sp. BJC16-A38]|uniref:hypothetical protein n=1 Tax=Mucilaginibacter phenanthrenivorans TaxID=1234842 RepID=UPI002158301E|nr:hypothetical protein [Mucilaginibacter phenanthrenivorans]MCR8557998.1 hypothetical protein [Mucilaginibacter phenanthrenivorans]
MNKQTKLDRQEMKKVTGGSLPTCTITCYLDSQIYTTVTVTNYPVGSGCVHAPLTDYCPNGYDTYATCNCQSGGSL